MYLVDDCCNTIISFKGEHTISTHLSVHLAKGLVVDPATINSGLDADCLIPIPFYYTLSD